MLSVSAADITQHADRINYWNSEQHTVTVNNDCNASTQVNITLAGSFAYSSGCTLSGSVITCDIPAASSASYVVTSSAADSEYALTTFAAVTNNSCTANDVRFLKIKDYELFHTLVEYGRGRGNYFFDTYGGGNYAGSGHTGTGCSYLPSGAMFELNYLHKMNNIKQYFGDLTATAYNATFSCVYTNDTVVREHLDVALVTNSTGTYVTYLIPSIEGSWERMGYIGLDYDAGDYNAGQNFTINCTDISYYLPIAGGDIMIDEDSFTLHVVDKNPFAATSTTTSTIGNGTQEVIITYDITNTGLYAVNDVIIEIQAPPYAQFIGTRGELWGYAQDQYRIEKAQLLPGESETVRLVARFDTTNAPNINSVALTSGIKIRYVTCWELNAYNPNEYTQTVTGTGNGTVNMGMNSTIISVIDTITKITNITRVINSTVNNINSTVTQINSIVNFINQTTQDTNIIVNQINQTTTSIYNKTNIIISNTNIILNDTSYIIDLLNCNGTTDTPICDKVRQLNNSVYYLLNFSQIINYTANNLNITIIKYINTSGVNVSINIDFTNITNRLREIKTYINCTNATAQPNTSVCNRLERIENYTAIINSSVNNLFNITTYFNNTFLGNYTFIDILNKISNSSADTTIVKNALDELRAFDEETVFLITDSFGLQQQAYADLEKGDVISAADNLIESNAKLRQTLDMITLEQQKLASGQQTQAAQASKGTDWTLITLLVTLMVVIMIYVTSRKIPPKQEENKGVLKIMLLMIVALSAIQLASADPGFGPLGTIKQEAADLNFGNTPKNMTVDIYYNCTGVRVFNVSLLSGVSVTATGAPCGLINSSLISCNFNSFSPFNKGYYTISITPAAFPDYTLFSFPISLSNNTDCSFNNLSQIKVPDEEIFYTLVEYGRGRGNYFYSTMGGTGGSGHTEAGCKYVPNGTLFELNFLHKIFSIKQYYNDPTMIVENATFTCTYPNRTIVRSHLGTAISQSGSGTTITYKIDEVTGDWERMGYVGMQFDPSEQYVGQNLTISCVNISYYVPTQSGYVTVYKAGTTFNLQVRDPTPFTASASTVSTIANGTQEVIIRYNITNTELYTADSAIIEIEAPPYAEFIGTRGELWGYAQDQYRLEKISIGPGQSEIIDLVARFDTTNAPNMTSTVLSNGVKVTYVTCWDLNAYNPAETTQRIYNIGNGTVNMGVPSTVVDIRERLIEIFNTLTIINTTTTSINSTVNNINSVVNVINSTTINTNLIASQINNTVNSILNNTMIILSNTNSIINNTAIIKDLLNCNGTTDTPICSGIDIINSTVTNMTNIFIDINNTLNNITINITIDISGENISVNVTPDITNITIILDDIMSELNCSNITGMPDTDVCKRLIRIENNTLTINQTINTINNIVQYFNLTTFGNVTLKQIYEALDNTTVDFTDILNTIRRMREFDEELVFLVTDSFGLQQEARSDMDNGNIGEAAAKLKEANDRLNEAAVRLMQVQNQDTTETATQETGKTRPIVLTLLLAVMALVVAVYLVARPPKGKQKKQMIDQIKTGGDDLEPPKPG